MIIESNIEKIVGGGYSISEVKYMEQTVWSDKIKIQISNFFSRYYGEKVILNGVELPQGTNIIEFNSNEELKKWEITLTFDEIYKRYIFKVQYTENGQTKEDVILNVTSDQYNYKQTETYKVDYSIDRFKKGNIMLKLSVENW